MLQLALNHITGNPGHCTGDIADKQCFLGIVHQAEQCTGVAVVIGVFAVLMAISRPVQGLSGLSVAWRLLGRISVAVGLVVRRSTTIIAKSH